MGSAVSLGWRRAPVWLLGLTNALFGMYGGILVIAVPQLLSARHVPEAMIAGMTAAAISPGFWTFLVVRSSMFDLAAAGIPWRRRCSPRCSWPWR